MCVRCFFVRSFACLHFPFSHFCLASFLKFYFLLLKTHQKDAIIMVQWYVQINFDWFSARRLICSSIFYNNERIVCLGDVCAVRDKKCINNDFHLRFNRYTQTHTQTKHQRYVDETKTKSTCLNIISREKERKNATKHETFRLSFSERTSHTFNENP